MTGRTALVLGISGQDGSYMADLLSSKKYRVVGTTRNPAATRERFLKPGWENIELHDVDLLNLDAIAAVIARTRPAEIYNFAAFSTGSGMYDQPVAIGDLNGLTVARILEVIKGTSIRFCQASSSEMFGTAPVCPQDETTPLSPRSPYGAAKLFAHNLIGIARQRDSAFACSAILFNHESPRRPAAFVTRKVTRAAAAIRVGTATDLVLGDLQARRDWGHAVDVVRAMWLMLQADRADDYVIATGETHSVADLCRIAFDHVGLDWTHYVRVNPALKRVPDAISLVGDAAYARRRLSWVPTISFETMVKEMVDADIRDLQLASPDKEDVRD